MRLTRYRGIIKECVTEDTNLVRLHESIEDDCSGVFGAVMFHSLEETRERLEHIGYCNVATIYFDDHRIEYIIEK